MARRFDGKRVNPTGQNVEVRSVDRSTARAFSAAISALAIATLVISTSSDALQPEGTIAESSISAGTISLTDDDGGRQLVDLANMAPLRPVEECIAIRYEGSIVPVSLTMAVELTGDLAPFVSTRIVRGWGAGYGRCDDFDATDELFVGTLDELGASPIDLGSLHNQGDVVTFRMVFELADDAEAMGRSSTAAFVWEAAPR